MAWAARGAHNNNENLGADGGYEGYALTVWRPEDFDTNLYFYQGRESQGSSSVVASSPLSLLTSDIASETTDPANADVILIAGGGGQGGVGQNLFEFGDRGGTGATAIANADPNGPVASTQGGSSRGGNPSPYIGGGGTGGSHDGASGIGGKGSKLWSTDGPLIPPESWSAGAGSSGLPGGGGFGGGGSPPTNSARGAGGGGSWAAANTVYDATAPTSKPSNPNGKAGALQLTYVTDDDDCSLDTDTDTTSVTCTLPDDTTVVDLSTLLSIAAWYLPSNQSIGAGSPMFIRAWGGKGGGGKTVGGHGFAQTLMSLSDYREAYDTEDLYYYIGAQGTETATANYRYCGTGGAASIVASQDLDFTSPCIDGEDCDTPNILLVAGGGGGSGDYDEGADGGQAVATTSGSASGTGDGQPQGGKGGGNGKGGAVTTNYDESTVAPTVGTDGIGGEGGPTYDKYGEAYTVWLNADSIAKVGGNGSGGTGGYYAGDGGTPFKGGGGGGGWGGGGGGDGFYFKSNSDEVAGTGGGGGGSYARQATQDATLPDASISGKDGAVVIGWIATETDAVATTAETRRTTGRTTDRIPTRIRVTTRPAQENLELERKLKERAIIRRQEHSVIRLRPRAQASGN